MLVSRLVCKTAWADAWRRVTHAIPTCHMPACVRLLCAPEDTIADQFIKANECCLGSFGRAFRKNFGTVALVRSAEAQAVLCAWHWQLRFTTAPVECEHAQIKNEVASNTSGVAHAGVAHRAVCRHLHQAHIHRGGADNALPLRRRHLVDAMEAQSRCWPDEEGLSMGTPAIVDEHSEAPLATAVAPLTCDVPSLDAFDHMKLGGGNPKVMYINYQMHRASVVQRGSLTRAGVAALRSELVEKYDGDADLRGRWRTLFDSARRRKAEQVALSSASREVHSSALWPGDMQPAGDQRLRLPIAESALAACHTELFGSQKALEDFSKDATAFQITSPPSASSTKAGSPWPPFGCAAEMHNCCRQSLRQRGVLGRFDRWQVAWRACVRALPKADAMSGDVLWHVRSRSGLPCSLWLLLVDIVYNPLVQTFALCCPEGHLADDGFDRHATPATPFALEILSSTCRLCDRGVGNFKGLRFATSDEVLERIAIEGADEWDIARVEYSVRTEGSSLRFMVVTGFGVPVALDTKKKAKVACDDAFLDWLQVVQGQSRRRHASSVASASGSGLRPERADAQPAAGEPPSLLEAGGGEPFAEDYIEVADVTGDALEELLEALVDEMGSDDDDNDEETLGVAEPAALPPSDRPCPSGDGSPREERVPAGPDPEAVDVVDKVISGWEADESRGAATVKAPDASSTGEEFPECGFVLSSIGYVRCNRPGFDPERTIGLVGYKTDGKSIFANCHLHSVCSISAGIMRQDVPREHMAEWLAKGIPPPPGASIAERKALGVEHRKLWARPPVGAQ